MSEPVERKPVEFTQVQINDAFWAPRMRTNRDVTVLIQYQQLEITGRLAGWQWEPGMPNEPHYFWDSDIAKWIEAAAYSLATHPDAELEAQIDASVDTMAENQWDDGYLNMHYARVEPENRWTNLRDCHELYCAGHLIEAAVAYYEATGKRKLLDIMCRYADHIDARFGRDEGKLRGYAGHEEIELALVKLYRATGQQRYLDLASYFVDERGQQPHYFDVEAAARSNTAYYHGTHAYTQSHAPLREQTEVVGHAVRAGYIYSAMADLALETQDATLLAALERLWANLTARRIYITGGVGPTAKNEGFTVDYDLPNETAYAETCAAIALVFWAHRMLQVDPKGDYADVMERALYNGVLSGVSLSGDAFFYANPLAAFPPMDAFQPSHVKTRRQAWFGCACCPPNLARLLACLGEYLYSQDDEGIWVHLYAAGQARVACGGVQVALEQHTNYPWDGQVVLTVHTDQAVEMAMRLRIPSWCEGAALQVNGVPVDLTGNMVSGYARVSRIWQDGDTLSLSLPMPVQFIEAHPRVRQDAGRVAIQRGPLVYCLEEADNGPNLNDITVDVAEAEVVWRDDLLGGCQIIELSGKRRETAGWGDQLYRPLGSKYVPMRCVAIPYYAWANREEGEMLVWLNACGT